MTAGELAIIRGAISEAAGALGALRRCHGLDVTELCYPAVNTVREAEAIFRRYDVVDSSATP